MYSFQLSGSRETINILAIQSYSSSLHLPIPSILVSRARRGLPHPYSSTTFRYRRLQGLSPDSAEKSKSAHIELVLENHSWKPASLRRYTSAELRHLLTNLSPLHYPLGWIIPIHPGRVVRYLQFFPHHGNNCKMKFGLRELVRYEPHRQHHRVRSRE